MGYTKFGKDLHRPDGDWVQTTHLLQVAGIPFRKPAVRAFAKAVARAEKRRAIYGLNLERQPNHPEDPNAIAVYGVSEVRSFFRTKTREWHVGYVPREVAADVCQNLLANEVPISVELYEIFADDNDYYELKFFLLAPPGYGVAKRMRL